MPIKSIKNALDVLDLFLIDGPELGVSEIARKLDMNISKVSRVLSIFTQYQILSRSPSQKYSLGVKVVQLSGVLLSQNELRRVALPYLKDLNSKTTETVGIYIRQEEKYFCLDRIDSSQHIRRAIRLGELHPLHAGAVGRLFLASMAEQQINDFIERNGLPRILPNTITDRSMLENELNKIRKEGVAVSFEELIPLSASVAAPIMAYNGEVTGVLAISGPVARFNYNKVEEYSTLVKETAAQISLQLGYQEIHKTPLPVPNKSNSAVSSA